MLICKTHTFTYLYTLTHPQTDMHTYSLTPKTWSRTIKSTLSLMHMDQFSSVQSFSHVRLFATPWTAAPQANLSIINSRSLLKLVSIESVMPSNHLILCRPLLLLPASFPASGSLPVSRLLASGAQSIGASASSSVLPVNLQALCPLGWTGLILQSKGLSEVFSSTTVGKHQFFGA